jgi:hypothetical protein
MWRYGQSTGAMFNSEGDLIGTGYSGAPTARNDPAQQDIHGIGPIPRGRYKLAAMLAESEHGPYAIVLVPYPSNIMYGRSGFMIHGDNIHLPGTASHGCIIQQHETRVSMWTSADHDLEVA